MMFGRRTVGTVAYMGGVPAVLEEFTWAWGQMVQYNGEYLCEPGEAIFYDRTRISYHAAARNDLAHKMRGDWLVMLDTDHAFEPDIVARLVGTAARHDVSVVSGMYVYKQPPHNPVVFPRVDGRLGYLGDWDRDVDLLEMGASGAGCLFVKRAVFDRIASELAENPFEIRKGYSEDNSFFDRLLQLGVKAYCAPQIENPHLGVRGYTLADYQPDRSLMSERRQAEGRIMQEIG